MDDDLEIARHGLCKLFSSEDAGQQHQRLINSRLMKCDGFRQARDREGVCVIERAGDIVHPVPVGIRLDHRHYFGAGGCVANDCQVFLEGTEANKRPGSERHG